jgi:acyl-CoA thioesterase-2
MSFDFDDLLAALALRDLGAGCLEGDNLDIGYHRVFGGQLLAQMLVAAGAQEPDKSIKSLHTLFPREGDTATPMEYRASTVHAGRTFATVQVVATQGARLVATALASMHADEDGLHRSDEPPAVGTPEKATATDLWLIPWETRVVGGVDLADAAAGPPDLHWWMRTPSLPDDQRVHQALLAHATDLTMIGTALRPFDGISQADSTRTLQTAVTSHTLWFHQPFRMDDWLLVAQHSPVVARGRAFARGDVFAGDRVVASFAQEAMVRQSRPPH